jgi:hypothetical protein
MFHSFPKEGDNARDSNHHYVATLGCGVGLTLTAMALWKLLCQLKNGGLTFLVFQRTQVPFLCCQI